MATGKELRSGLTAERLREIVSYSQEDGRFYWLISRQRVIKGSRAGYRPKSCWYERIAIDGTSHLAHRLAWLHVHGRWPDDQIDHVDGNKMNNAISNLRECRGPENQQNMKARPGKTGFAGVTTSLKKFVSQISVNGKQVGLGTFETAEEAHSAYLSAKAKYHTFCPTLRYV